MKKIFIFCLYCVIFTLIPAASILAQGGKDKSLKNKPFPVLEVPENEGDTYYLEAPPDDLDEDEDDFFLISDPAVNEAKPAPVPQVSNVNADKPAPAPQSNVNADRPAPAPQVSSVNEENRADTYTRGGAESNAVGNAVVSAAESAASAAQSAAAAAQSAQVAESAAAVAAQQQPQPLPPAYQPQPQPVPSRLPPQSSARTVVPTVNIILPPAAPSVAQPVPPPAVPPPVYRPSLNVIPGMPDPYCNGVFRVQLGAFSNTGLAQQCFNRLKSAGFTPYYEQYGSLYRVVITGIPAADIAAVIRRLEAAGFTEAWIREER